jgi:hypothetical protein
MMVNKRYSPGCRESRRVAAKRAGRTFCVVLSVKRDCPTTISRHTDNGDSGTNAERPFSLNNYDFTIHPVIIIMPYIGADGNVIEKRSNWRLSIVTDFFAAIWGFFALFFTAITNPEAVKVSVALRSIVLCLYYASLIIMPLSYPYLPPVFVYRKIEEVPMVSVMAVAHTEEEEMTRRNDQEATFAVSIS